MNIFGCISWDAYCQASLDAPPRLATYRGRAVRRAANKTQEATSQNPAAKGTVDELREAFEKRYLGYQYHVVEFLTEHLADVSRAFAGDLQEMLVLAIIGQKHLRAAVKGHDGETAISASRIADVTGIPRQTVRRKLKSLEARGWIVQTPDASYKLVVHDGASVARSELQDVDRRSIERVARMHLNLTRLLASQPPRGD